VLREIFSEESTLSLQTDIRRPYKTIAAKLRVSEDTVRNRVQNLEVSGLIRGWKLGLNPNLLGYRICAVFLDFNPSSLRNDVINEVGRIPHVFSIQSYLNDVVGFNVGFKDGPDLGLKLDLLKQEAGSTFLQKAEVPFKKCNLSLSRTDVSIVRSYLRNPRKPYGEVARELRISRRTVKRRTEKMIKEGGMFLLPEIDLKALGGGMLVSLSIFHSPEFKERVDSQVIARFRDMLLIAIATNPQRSWFGFVVPNPSVAKDMELWVRSLEGVGDVLLLLVSEFFNMLDETLIEELTP
jgi:DNA-binding Lrp family transcriptional regulator